MVHLVEGEGAWPKMTLLDVMYNRLSGLVIQMVNQVVIEELLQLLLDHHLGQLCVQPLLLDGWGAVMCMC